MGDYQGSQAFAQTSGGVESVNRNTGSLNYSIPLIELRGVVKAVDLTLSLTYSAGTSGTFGLPQNWTFGISYVIPHKTVTTRGRTYVIDNQWADATGYHSGLKYINNHGMLFKPQVPPQELPSGNPGHYGWSFRYTDGAIDYFDVQGKLLEHDDIHGNYIYYSYVDPGASPQTARLEFIQDSWKQRTKFGYEPGTAIYVTGPNSDQITISYGHDGVSQIQFPIDLITSFNYHQVASRIVIQSIQQSSGLRSSFTYQTLDYLDLFNNKQSLPAVRNHSHRDANGKYLSQTTYEFGTASSGRTFTGYAIQKQMGGDSDRLMDSGESSYQYDTLVLNIDANNKIISATRIMFNYLHLPLIEFHYAIDHAGYLADTFRAVNTYIIDPDKHARTPNYTSPYTVEHFTWDTARQVWQGLRQADSRSDNYGCVTLSRQFLWNPQQRRYLLQQQRTSTYVPTTWGGQMLRSETYVDAITGFTKQLIYGLTADQKNVESIETSYQTSGATQFTPWKIKNSSYDGQGRVLVETVAWAHASSAPAGSVSSYTNRNVYSFDSTNNHLTVTAIDPQAKATISKYATKIRKGPLVEKQLPLGQKETFTYDVLGRQFSRTDPLNNTTTMTYNVSQTANSVSSVASNGYRLKYILDALGRRVQLLDNGDPSSSPSEPTRTLYTKTYDSVSRITSKTDGAGLVTLYNAYDGFNRILSVTDPDKNVITNTYDDVHLEMTSSINGSLRAKTQLDAFSRKISASKYADSSDTSINYYITETYEYDGFGKVVRLEHYQNALDKSSMLRLGTTVRTFDVEDNMQLETITYKSDVADKAYDTVQRTFVRDIFGLIYTHSKATTYSDGRSFTQNGATYVYDNCKLLIQHQNEIGQKEKYIYDDNGWRSSVTRFDGSIVKYAYDGLGRLATAQDSAETETRIYFSNGRLASISVSPQGSSTAKSVAYSYSLDGSATAVTYPNNQKTSYGLDNLGRIITQTDVYGTQRIIVFNAQGHVATRSIGNDTVTYTYGTANHTYGQLLQNVTIGAKKQLRTIQYDGYGRAKQVIVTDTATSAVLLSSQYQYNAQNRLRTVKMSSSVPKSKQLNCTKNFSYDGFGQLVIETTAYADDTTTTVNFVYDGNCNLLSKTQDEITEKRTYNDIGQRTDPGFTYDTNGRMRTDNRGRTYTYFADDRLQSAQGVIFAYHPDGSLASSTSEAAKTSFYYDNGVVNGTNTANDSKSYLLEPGRRLASYNKSSSDPTYYVENNGSTVLTVAPSTTSVNEYGAYGTPTDAAAQDDHFGYRQEFTEPSSGLIYLRSRFYQPDHAAFITMDVAKKENRYAYCGGDPVNRSDLTGHSGGGAMAAGIVAGIATTIIMGVITGGLATYVFGPTCIAASISAAAVSGAAGNVVGDAVGDAAAHERINGSSLAIDALAGAVGGAVGAGSGGAAGRLAMQIAEPSVQEVANVARIGDAVSSVVGGAAGTISGGAVENIGNGRPLFSGDSALSFVTGAVGGLGGGVLTSMSYLAWGNPNLLPVLATEGDLKNMKVTTDIVGAPPHAKVLKSFTIPAEKEADEEAFSRDGFEFGDMLRLKKTTGNMLDTFVIHGQGRDVFPAMTRTVNGVETYITRPMKGYTFAKELGEMQRIGNFGDPDGEIKAFSCYAALHNAQAVANATQRNVWGSYRAINGQEPNINWKKFTPR